MGGSRINHLTNTPQSTFLVERLANEERLLGQ